MIACAGHRRAASWTRSRSSADGSTQITVLTPFGPTLKTSGAVRAHCPPVSHQSASTLTRTVDTYPLDPSSATPSLSNARSGNALRRTGGSAAVRVGNMVFSRGSAVPMMVRANCAPRQ
jgi:hypothetical protein